jgi:hypothetical protein
MKDRRGHFRKGLHPVYLPYFDALCGLLPDHWQPVSGLRSFQEQSALYALGRTVKNPQGIVTWSKPGYSYHNYGLATDWDYFDGDKYTPLMYGSDCWKEYIDACNKAGVRYLQSERPHNEYPLVNMIQDILKAWNQGGSQAVDEALRKTTYGPLPIDGPVSD